MPSYINPSQILAYQPSQILAYQPCSCPRISTLLMFLHINPAHVSVTSFGSYPPSPPPHLICPRNRGEVLLCRENQAAVDRMQLIGNSRSSFHFLAAVQIFTDSKLQAVPTPWPCTIS
jgi:hypothetical protein